MNNTGIVIIRIFLLISTIFSLFIQSIILCRNNATYEYTSSVAPRHTQRVTSQESNRQKNKRIKR